jgi:NAD(P)-dependent dehydrogenase (short-subunit alcohol dehydrogenase family)
LASDRAILITGCSSGIGWTLAKGLAARGYRVFATARKLADVQRLRRAGLESFALDLNDDAGIAQAFSQVLDATDGRLYGLINNGAYGQTGAVEDLSRAVLRAQLETNLLGWHELTRLVIPVMRAEGEGRIIQNSSVLGLVALPFRGAYVCSKFALEGLSDTLRLELADTNIAVSLIEPGPISSRFRENAAAVFRATIDVTGSPHRLAYAAQLARLTKPGPAAPFTLPPEAVLPKVIHALESPRPRARYYVTVPTHLLGYLRRLLSTRALDRVLHRVSGSGRR